MIIKLTPLRIFLLAAVSAMIGSMLFLFVVIRSDFPNSSPLSAIPYCLIPAVPVAIICGFAARILLFRDALVDELQWPIPLCLLGGILIAIIAVFITMCGGMLLGILGWAFATPP